MPRCWVRQVEFLEQRILLCSEHVGPEAEYQTEPFRASPATAFFAEPQSATAASSIPFTKVIVDPISPREPHCKAVGDINGDGFDDIIIGSGGINGLWWYEYPTWEYHPIKASGWFSNDMQAGDVDNDGDVDLITPGVNWYENPGAGGDYESDWPEHYIGASDSHDLEVGDIDNDGKLDAIARPKDGRETNVFFQNSPTSWTKITVTTEYGEGTALGDIDHDGDLDIAHSGYWIENPATGGGAASRVPNWTRHTIDTDWPALVGVHVADINDDGRNDIALAPSETANDRFSWYEATDPKTGPWIEHVIDPSVSYFHTFKSGDVDLDGDLDLITAEMHQSADPDEVSVYFNEGDGLNWSQQVLDNIGSHNIRVTDIGSDGDLDIVGANWNDVAPDSALVNLWQNDLDPVLTLDQWQRHEIESNLPWRTMFVKSADVDEDGLTDVLSGGWWYRNPGAPGGSWTRSTIGSPLDDVAAVFDLNGDGKIDLFGSDGANDFAWARNLGNGALSVLQNIQDGAGNYLQGVAIDRFGPSGTGPIEIALSWHDGGGGVQMLTVVPNATVDQWPIRYISDSHQDEEITSGDIDRDGDKDLLLGTQWLRNDQGSWTTFDINPALGADRNRLADINRDGRLDAVVGFESISAPGDVVWYEQPVDPTGPWTPHLVRTIIGPMSLDVRDMDADGDLDIIAGEHNRADYSTARMLIFENADGAGGDWVDHVVHTGDEHHDGAHVVDIDNDGDLDIVSIGWDNDQVVLYENRNVVTGATAVATPTISPTGGTFAAPVQVTLATATPGAAIYYTLDGSAPTQASLLYGGPFTVSDDATVRARAFRAGFDPSAIASTSFVISTPGGGNGRVRDDLAVLYTFDEGAGSTIFDESGVGSPLNLGIPSGANVTWNNGSLSLNAATLIASAGAASKISNAVISSNAITIEAWITPINTTQNGPARIVTLSSGSNARNFTLGQDVGPTYDVRLRTTTTGANGASPSLWTPNGTVETNLQHVVYTRDAAGLAKIYVDGEAVSSGTIGGNLSNWDTSFALALGREFGNTRPWRGSYHLMAIYGDALSASEVQQNFAAGAEPVEAPPPAWLTASPEAAYVLTSDALTVSEGTITFVGDAALTHPQLKLVVQSGATVAFDAPQRITDLTIETNGKLDLRNHSLAVDYTGASPIGAWNGSAYSGLSGMIASGRMISTHADLSRRLGIAEAKDAAQIAGGQTQAWNGHVIDATTVLIKFSYAGDANLSGHLDIDDYGQLDFNVSTGGALKGYFNGDFTLDGVIDIDDHGLIDFALSTHGPPM